MAEKIVRQGMKIGEVRRALSRLGFESDPSSKSGAVQWIHRESSESLRDPAKGLPITVSVRSPLDALTAQRITKAVNAFLESRK